MCDFDRFEIFMFALLEKIICWPLLYRNPEKKNSWPQRPLKKGSGSVCAVINSEGVITCHGCLLSRNAIASRNVIYMALYICVRKLMILSSDRIVMMEGIQKLKCVDLLPQLGPNEFLVPPVRPGTPRPTP